MRRAVVAIAASLLLAATARAEVAMAWSSAAGVILVVHDGRIEGFDRAGEKRLWSAEGVDTPSSIVLSPDGKAAAVLDAFGDRVAVVSLSDGAVRRYDAPSTPIVAAFFGRDLWVVTRDRRTVQRITPEGAKTEVVVQLDPALIAAGERSVYVYSRADGVLQELDPAAAKVTRSADAGTGASDLEIQGNTAYLCRPANGRIMTIDLLTMGGRELAVGVAPVDLAPGIDAGTLVLADPGKQLITVTKSLSSQGTPIVQRAPVDRIAVSRAGIFAFDTNSGTLYRESGRLATKVAAGLTPAAFVATDDALFTWDAKAARPHREAAAETLLRSAP